MFFDSHCHLDDPRLRQLLPAVIDEAKTSGVAGFLVPGVDPEGWQRIRSLADSYRCVTPAYGLHPMHADRLSPDLLSELRLLSRNAGAIGEIGLDYSVDFPTREVQQAAFRAQLEIAAERDLPVLIHCRKAFNDVLGILRESRSEWAGVMHAFSGSVETAGECLRLGLHISLAGSATYANAVRPVQVARVVPLERLLLETDAPDLSPEPHRGELNRPCYLLETARRVAELRGMTLEELAQATTANAIRLFGLGPDLSLSR